MLIQYEQDIQALKAENAALTIACEEKSSAENNGLRSTDAQVICQSRYTHIAAWGSFLICMRIPSLLTRNVQLFFYHMLIPHNPNKMLLRRIFLFEEGMIFKIKETLFLFLQESEAEMLSELQEELMQSKQETESVRSKLKAAIKKGKRIEQEKSYLEVSDQRDWFMECRL